MPSKTESAEDLFQDLFENVKHDAASCRRLAREARERVAAREGMNTSLMAAVRDERDNAAAIAFDLAAQKHEENIENFQEFFCLGCGKYMHKWSERPFGLSEDSVYIDVADPRICEVCAEVAAEDAADNHRFDVARDAQIGEVA